MTNETRELREAFAALRDLPALPMPEATRGAFTAAMLRAHDLAAEPLRVLVTVNRDQDSGAACADVDYLPEGVTVEIRNFDTKSGEPFAVEIETDPREAEGASIMRDVELVRAGDDDQLAGIWRRADNARPEFDGPAPEPDARPRCADCGELGENTGHMGCQYPGASGAVEVEGVQTMKDFQ